MGVKRRHPDIVKDKQLRQVIWEFASGGATAIVAVWGLSKGDHIPSCRS
jgi:hypothetical protein